ncbi:HNH endonuclease signature motif containing protein [Promicromonospora sukumoe]|uniref:HNH endonuclease signature motif containing protein n=1 Tax=Promicromonospora sukumoe TaxID=88382 RepID=UPI00039F2D86|nr:HNH endonuclease signature motif containing protein [Promicromonospora sukumoe]
MVGEQGSGTARPVENVLADLDKLLDELTRSLAQDTGALAAGILPTSPTTTEPVTTRSTTTEPVSTARLVAASARLRVAGTRLDAVRWSILPRIENAGLWAQTGARSFAVWLARTEDTRTQTARRDVRTAKALRDHLPATLLAALSGRVGADKVRALVDLATTSATRTEALAAPAIDLATIEPVTDGPTSDPTNAPTAGDTSEEDTTSDDGGSDDGDSGPAPTNPAHTNSAHTNPAPTDPASTNLAPGSPVVDDPPRAALAPAVPTWEEQLLVWSNENGPDRFRGLVRYFARHADPDADERGFTKAGQREYLDVAPTLGGYHLSGFLTEEHGQTLTTAIGSVMGAPAADDDRTPGQRRAQALADLSRVVLDNGHTGTGAAVRPHLSVTVSWTELQTLAAKNAVRFAPRQTTDDHPAETSTATPNGIRSNGPGPNNGGPNGSNDRGPNDPGSNDPGSNGPGSNGPGSNGTRAKSLAPSRIRTGNVGSSTPAGVSDIKRPAVFTETSSPVPASLLRRLACDSEVTRIVFGPDSQILDVGRAKRTVTGQLRRAVIARDKHCVYDQCDQPPTRCEVHHALRHWAHGGETSTTNAALLCYHHHDLVDKQNIAMHYDNGWHFTHPNGHVTRPTRSAGT